MTHESHVIVVDDHHDIRDLLCQYLSQHFLRVSAVASVAALRSLMARDTVDLIVLDIMMPGEDGLAACRQIRLTSQVPIIFWRHWPTMQTRWWAWSWGPTTTW